MNITPHEKREETVLQPGLLFVDHIIEHLDSILSSCENNRSSRDREGGPSNSHLFDLTHRIYSEMPICAVMNGVMAHGYYRSKVFVTIQGYEYLHPHLIMRSSSDQKWFGCLTFGQFIEHSQTNTPGSRVSIVEENIQSKGLREGIRVVRYEHNLALLHGNIDLIPQAIEGVNYLWQI